MDFIEIALAGYALVATLWLAGSGRAAPQLARWVAALGLVLVAASLAFGAHRLAAVPLTIVAIGTAALALIRSRRGVRASLPRRTFVRAVLRWAPALGVLVVVVLDAAFITILDPLSNDPVRDLIEEAHAADFSRLPWPAAFEELHGLLSHAYAMGVWKRIDWAAMYERTAPKIAAAAGANDRAAYYRALREYLWSIPDGHIDLSGDDGGQRSTAIRGGFGLALLRLDDGQTIVHVVTPAGPAARAGVRWGARIISWNGVPIDEAAARTSVLWSPNPPATSEGLHLARLKWLARAPVGTKLTLTFVNLGEAVARNVTLEAEDDEFAPVRAAAQSTNFSFRAPSIEWRVLPARVGYLKIRAELPTLVQPLPDRIVTRAVREFLRENVHGVIIDVRANIGGADKLVPLFMGWFVDEQRHFEHVALYDARTGVFERRQSATLFTEPRSPGFHGPLAVLVDAHCASSGEGLALVARSRPQSHIVGFYGTYGSFGISGAEIRMPEGLTVEYANGRSLDAAGAIQLDSDWRGEGGVVPDVRIPLNIATARAQFVDGRDVALETAIDLVK